MDSSFDLSAGAPALTLDETGFRLRRRWLERTVPYADVTHLAVSPRGIWIGSRRNVVFLRRSNFRDADGPELLARGLVARIGRLPGGLQQLARINAIDHIGRNPFPRTSTRALAILCIAVFALQLADPFVQEVGAFAPALVGEGEFWRVFTANFLHAPVFFALHLVFNLLALLAFAFLVERPLGPMRTVVVMGASALAAMFGSTVAGYVEVVGASGIVAGMAGAALCLELHFAGTLPSWWRIPRRLFVGVLLIEAVYGFAVPAIAGAAHLGGFAGGYLATLPLAGSALARRRAPTWVTATAGALLAATVLAFVASAPLVMRNAAALARYGKAVMALPEPHPGRFNDIAWRMVTESDPDRGELAVALELALRAVDETERQNPDLLDTLAEVFFASGDSDAAIETIDEAIALSPKDEYFREQRRRFTGERDADDRPEPPNLPWLFRRNPDLVPFPESPSDDGVTI